MQVDNVGHVSWQAQLKGQKLWVLQPPPECLYKCSFLQTILKPGDMSNFSYFSLKSLNNIFFLLITYY